MVAGDCRSPPRLRDRKGGGDGTGTDGSQSKNSKSIQDFLNLGESGKESCDHVITSSSGMNNMEGVVHGFSGEFVNLEAGGEVQQGRLELCLDDLVYTNPMESILSSSILEALGGSVKDTCMGVSHQESLEGSFVDGASIKETILNVSHNTDEHLGVNNMAGSLLPNGSRSMMPEMVSNPLFSGEQCVRMEPSIAQPETIPVSSSQNFKERRNNVPNAWAKPDNFKIDWIESDYALAPDGTVLMCQDSIKKNMQKLEMALVGKLLGRRVPFAVVLSELKKKWSHVGDFKLLMQGTDSFYCIFESIEARDKILMGGPWYVAGGIVGLDKWTAAMASSPLSGISSPVWIRFPLLPLLYWDNVNLARMAAALGKPLWIDGHTSGWGRCSYARVCVRIPLTKPLPKGIWIQGINGRFFQKVEYEGILSLCSCCGIIGHSADVCPEGASNAEVSGKGKASVESAARATVSVNASMAPPSNVPPVNRCSDAHLAPKAGVFGSSNTKVDKGKAPLSSKFTAGNHKVDSEGWTVVNHRKNKSAASRNGNFAQANMKSVGSLKTSSSNGGGIWPRSETSFPVSGLAKQNQSSSLNVSKGLHYQESSYFGTHVTPMAFSAITKPGNFRTRAGNNRLALNNVEPLDGPGLPVDSSSRKRRKRQDVNPSVDVGDLSVAIIGGGDASPIVN